MEEKFKAAAKLAYEHAKGRWDKVLATGGETECLIESTDVFHALDLAGLPPTDQNELAVEDVLSDLGYYTLAATAFKATQANRTAFGS